MTNEPSEEIGLRAWAAGDAPLLHRLLGDPEMTAHLGGRETPEQIEARHLRYLAMNERDDGRMLVITIGADRREAGSIGYWERASDGETVWETGWSVLPELQGRGIATRATRLVVEEARRTGRHRSIHAYPSVDNPASNAICRKAGFTLLGSLDFEYPKGHPMRCNDWVVAFDEPHPTGA